MSRMSLVRALIAFATTLALALGGAIAFSSPAAAEPAANMSYSLALGQCNSSSGRTTVYATFTNGADAGGQPFILPSVFATQVATGSPMATWADTPESIPDGSSYTVEAGGQPNPDTTGLAPGTWEIEFISNWDVVAKRRIWVPGCNPILQPPPGDSPGGPGTVDPGNPGTPGVTTAPRGQITVIKPRFGKVQAVVNNRKAAHSNVLLLIKVPKRGTPTKQTFAVQGGEVKRVSKYGKRQMRTTFYLFYKTSGGKWKELDRLSVRRR